MSEESKHENSTGARGTNDTGNDACADYDERMQADFEQKLEGLSALQEQVLRSSKGEAPMPNRRQVEEALFSFSSSAGRLIRHSNNGDGLSESQSEDFMERMMKASVVGRP